MQYFKYIMLTFLSILRDVFIIFYLVKNLNKIRCFFFKKKQTKNHYGNNSRKNIGAILPIIDFFGISGVKTQNYRVKKVNIVLDIIVAFWAKSTRSSGKVKIVLDNIGAFREKASPPLPLRKSLTLPPTNILMILSKILEIWASIFEVFPFLEIMDKIFEILPKKLWKDSKQNLRYFY